MMSNCGKQVQRGAQTASDRFAAAIKGTAATPSTLVAVEFSNEWKAKS
jgi:hypothetical protein